MINNDPVITCAICNQLVYLHGAHECRPVNAAYAYRPVTCPYCNLIFSAVTGHICGSVLRQNTFLPPNEPIGEVRKIAVIHNRTKFYGKEIYWYQLYNGQIPPKFVNILDTDYYEYGGNHNIALMELKDYGYKIIIGNDI